MILLQRHVLFRWLSSLKKFQSTRKTISESADAVNDRYGASPPGMTNHRLLRDLADVQELICVLSLPVDFQRQLNPFVRDRYDELWQAVKDTPDPEAEAEQK